MKVHEAVKHASVLSCWIRPSSWQGTGLALAPNGPHLKTMPPIGSMDYTPTIAELKEDWQCFHPDSKILKAERGTDETHNN